jgi:hypothetical protein
MFKDRTLSARVLVALLALPAMSMLGQGRNPDRTTAAGSLRNRERTYLRSHATG